MTDSIQTAPGPVELPAVLSTGEAEMLKAMLLDHDGRSICLDAGRVTQLGALCAQVLVSARTGCKRAGHEFSIVNISEPMECALNDMGLSAMLTGSDGDA